ncbi:MAG: bifunctional 5,10-methylenetetrahydrofolate dehydrogenase/5,10-methenyltetrahydrofolate cyclohydrolase [Candidatus Wildermuthbacteria bacterium]|nr:bifunctional 5,10-methylenetetrahydrofolate dehydrogenase/5,10-methenyltetrahydrofolate cyclohydrolase [Candidatus Wildermuthbacteria bacterium]
MARLLYGDKIAEEMIEKLAKQKRKGKLKLMVFRVGENAISAQYIAEKGKAAERVGVQFELVSFPKGTSQKKVREAVQEAGKSSRVSGIVVQLPLPAKFNTQEILDAIPVEKDVDVLSSRAFGLFALGKLPILPPTAHAIMLLLEYYNIAWQGKHIVVVGAGRLVGLPAILSLVMNKATFTSVNEKTKSLAAFTRQADILISGVGKPKLIKPSMLKKEVVVVDAGTSLDRGTTTGDVDFNSVVEKVRAITPVPGGIGPLTIACLLSNLCSVEKTLL